MFGPGFSIEKSAAQSAGGLRPGLPLVLPKQSFDSTSPVGNFAMVIAKFGLIKSIGIGGLRYDGRNHI